MIKIALVIDGLAFGGAESGVLRLYHSLNQRTESQCSLFVLGDKLDFPTNQASRIHFVSNKVLLGWRPLKELILAARLKAALALHEDSFDLVISNTNSANRITKKSKIKNVFYFIRNNLEQEAAKSKRPKRHKALFHDILNNEHCFCVSDELKDHLLEGDYIRPNSISLLRNPMNLDSIKTLSLQQNIEIPNEPFLLHIGRVAPQKRHDVLMEAYANLKEPIELVCISNKPDELRKIHQSSAAAHKNLILKPFQKNPYPWIKRAEAVIISSDHEGVSNVMLESLALGTKVVSTNCSYGPREVMTGRLAKLLVEAGNPGALAEKIDDVINQPVTITIDQIAAFEQTQPEFMIHQIQKAVELL